MNMLKSYGLDSISCTEFVRVMGYKSLLLSDHAITALLVCRRGGGRRRGGANYCHFHGPNPNRGSGGVEQRMKEEEVRDRGV